MKYLVGLTDLPTEDNLKQLTTCEVDILYVSRLLPLVGVECQDVSRLSRLLFVKYTRPSRKGQYATLGPVITIPSEPATKAAREAGLVGWNTKVVMLDSGYNGIRLEGEKDFTGTGINDNSHHGTFVAHLIKHFAPGCQLFCGKIGNNEPDELLICMGLEWAKLDVGARIINLSAGIWNDGLCSESCPMGQIIRVITNDQETIVVVAAGNGNQKVGSICCPGCSGRVVTVGAVDVTGKGIATYSSIGLPGSGKPNIVAPGAVSIGSDYNQGTSFAAPIVAGTLAAIYTATGGARQAINLVYTTATDLGLPSHYQGNGRLNIPGIVEEIKNAQVNNRGERSI